MNTPNFVLLSIEANSAQISNTNTKFNINPYNNLHFFMLKYNHNS